MSLQQLSVVWRWLGLPVADVVAVEVDECPEQLFHDQGGLLLSQVLPFENEVKEFAAIAVPVCLCKSD